MLQIVLSRAIIITLVCVAFASNAIAVPLVLSHQGRLLDSADEPLSGVFTIIYSIHDAPVGGTQLWMEDHVGVVVTDGLFSVELGTTVPITAEMLHGSGGGGGGGSLRYLQVQLSGQPPIMPRTQLVAAPYAVASHSVSGDIETFPSGFKTRCPGCNDPWRGDISAASSVGADSINVIRLNGLPPGTPVTGRVAMAVTGDISSIALGDVDADGQLDMRCGPDSTVFDLGASEGGLLVSSYRAKAGKTGATKRMMHSGGGSVSTIDEDCDDAAEMRMSSMGVGGDVSSSSIYCDPDSIVVLEKISDGRADVVVYKATTGKTGRAKSSLLVVPGGGTVAETEDCDDGGTERSMNVSNIGSSGQENGTLDRITADSILTNQTVMNSGTLLSSYTAKQGSTGRTKRTAAFTLDGSRSQDDEVVSAVNGVRRKLETHNLGSSGQDGISDLRCTPDSIVQENIINEGGNLKTVTYTAKQGKTGSASGKRTINPDGGSSETEEVCDTTGASLKLTIDSTPARISTNVTIGKQTQSATFGQRYDSDGDGTPEQEISSAIVPTRAQHAVNTKGSGAQIGRVVSVSSSTDVDSALHEISLDDDGDGNPESKVRHAASASISEIVVTKNQDTSDGRILMSVTADSTVLDLGHHSSVTGTLKLQVGSSGTANPIEHSSGAHLTSGGVWTNSSDANLKENFRSVDGAELLEKIEELPINQWNYKAESDQVTHIGPTAQDFKAAFGVGSDGKSISTIDPSGIALAAIQELYSQLKQKDEALSTQAKLIEELQKRLAGIERELKKK